MSSATATVEVLTAEVRVLMVGSRQVTLSVYRQLDRVEPQNIEPFGRVSDVKDPGGVAVVGKDENGVLVRGWLADKEGSPMTAAEFQRVFNNRDPEYGDVAGYHYNDALWGLNRWEDTLSHEARMQTVGEWQQLPLIVLAGLR